MTDRTIAVMPMYFISTLNIAQRLNACNHLDIHWVSAVVRGHALTRTPLFTTPYWCTTAQTLNFDSAHACLLFVCMTYGPIQCVETRPIDF